MGERTFLLSGSYTHTNPPVAGVALLLEDRPPISTWVRGQDLRKACGGTPGFITEPSCLGGALLITKQTRQPGWASHHTTASSRDYDGRRQPQHGVVCPGAHRSFCCSNIYIYRAAFGAASSSKRLARERVRGWCACPGAANPYNTCVCVCVCMCVCLCVLCPGAADLVKAVCLCVCVCV